MKPSEIKVGATYQGVSGNIRRIVGDADTRKPGTEHDALQYEVVSGPSAGATFSCTRAAFAKWAVRQIDTSAESPDGAA